MSINCYVTFVRSMGYGIKADVLSRLEVYQAQDVWRQAGRLRIGRCVLLSFWFTFIYGYFLPSYFIAVHCPV